MENSSKLSKKQVVEDWQKHFPQLSCFSNNKIYKRITPLIIGIELIALPRSEEYRPYFVVYPLWKNSINECLKIPIILKEYYNNRGLQFSIPYNVGSPLFADAVNSVRNASPLPFDRDIFINDVFAMIDTYSKEKPLSASPNSYLQAVLQQSKLEIGLYSSTECAENILMEIKQRIWDKNHFDLCGVSINSWLNNLERIIANRDLFLGQIRDNMKDRKIEKLSHSTLLF